MKVNRLRSLCIKIYESINNINPLYMNEIFKLRKTSGLVCSNYYLNLDVGTINHVSLGDKSLRYYGLKIWNSLSFHIKSSENLEAFKNIIRNWDGISCKCKVWKYHQVLANYFKHNILRLHTTLSLCNIWCFTMNHK